MTSTVEKSEFVDFDGSETLLYELYRTSMAVETALLMTLR